MNDFKSKHLILYVFILFNIISSCKQTEKYFTPAQETVLYYIYNKSLISDTFSRMVWQIPIDCRGYDSENRKLYFIFKRELGKSNVIDKMALDTSLIEFAPCETGICEFGSLRGNIDGYYAFRMPVTNMKIDTSIRFQCGLKSKKRSLSLQDLTQLRDTSICYAFPKYMIIASAFEQSYRASNIARYISKQSKDHVINKLALELTEGLKTLEEKAQKLLDFVSNEITYSYEDHWYQSEITKRAHEVLLAGQADCSGKSTLYASLLESVGIPYCLLYFDHHINVGVQGQFENQNNYNYTRDNVCYAMAETTVPGFKIGVSKLENAEILNTVLFYQNPSKGTEIYDLKHNGTLTLINYLGSSEEEE